MRFMALWSLFLAAIVACGHVAVGEESTVLAPSDPLYDEAKAECGNDLMVRVLDLTDDEAICCVSFEMLVPSLHCLTASGAVVDNPQSTARLAKPKH